MPQLSDHKSAINPMNNPHFPMVSILEAPPCSRLQPLLPHDFSWTAVTAALGIPAVIISSSPACQSTMSSRLFAANAGPFPRGYPRQKKQKNGQSARYPSNNERFLAGELVDNPTSEKQNK